MRVSDFVFYYLKKIGINHVFCLPGGGAMHLNDALQQSAIHSTICLHEQAVAIAAEYWGRVNNKKFGVALVTNGPGATNTLTSAAGAYIESVPLLIISGQVKTSDYSSEKKVRQTGVQEVATLEMVRPITKFQAIVKDSNQIEDILEKAIDVMLDGRKGPAWLEIPLDIQGAKYEPKTQIFTSNREKNKNNKEIIDFDYDQFISLIKNKKRVILLAGQGIRLDKSVDALIRFAEKFNIIVSTTFPGKDCFPYDHKLYIGHPGTVAKRSANIAIQNSDLLISIGCSLNNIITAYNPKEFARNAEKIVFDIDPNELSKVLPPNSFKIQLSASNALEILDKAFSENEILYLNHSSEWVDYCNQLKSRFSFKSDEAFRYELNNLEKNKISIYTLMNGLSKILSKYNYIVTGSSGFCIEAFYVLFENSSSQRILIDSGLGSMGFGLPGAIGVCRSTNDRVVLIEGDGSLQMNIQELATVKGNNLSLTIIVINNDGYCSIRNTQDGYFKGRHLGSDENSGLHLPSLQKLSQAYEISYENCNDLAKLENIIYNKDISGPQIIEVLTYSDEKLQPKVTSKPTKEGKMETMPIEDMSPLLSLEELKKWMKNSDIQPRSISARS